MAEALGRLLALTFKGSAVGGVREKGVTYNGEPVDITNDDNLGWRGLLSDAAVKSLDVSLSGLTKTKVLRQTFFSNEKTGEAVLTFPDGDTVTFDAYLASYEETGSYEDALTYEASLQSTGEVVYEEGSAPTNTVLPAISGIAQVGQVLTALEGEWVGASSFTYQWKNEGANIPGATSRTYTPVVGDVGDNLTVTVTALNGTGSGNVTSAETAPVIAA